MEFVEPHWLPSSCFGGGGNGQQGICVHHAASTDFNGIADTLESRGLSTHFAVGPGIVQQLCDYDACTWHCGDDWGNSNLISFETVNSGGDPDWPIAEETVDTVVELCAKIARDCNLGELVVGQNLYGHRDFYQTFCPGVLYDRLSEIAERANNINNGQGDDDMPTPGDLWNYELGSNAEAGKGNVPAWQHLSWAHHDTAALYASLVAPHTNAANKQQGVKLQDQVDFIDARVKEQGDMLAKIAAKLGIK